MAFLDPSDNKISLTKEYHDIINPSFSKYLLLMGSAVMIVTIGIMIQLAYSTTFKESLLPLWSVESYLLYSSIVILTISLFFIGALKVNIKNEKNVQVFQNILIIFLLIIVLTVFPILNAIIYVSMSFVILEVIYGVISLFIFSSIIKSAII